MKDKKLKIKLEMFKNVEKNCKKNYSPTDKVKFKFLNQNIPLSFRHNSLQN